MTKASNIVGVEGNRVVSTRCSSKLASGQQVLNEGVCVCAEETGINARPATARRRLNLR